MDIVIISGGSTGADTGALMAGKELGIKCVGNVYGNINKIKHYYHNYALSKNHTHKDITNVCDSDVVIAFRVNKELTGRGTDSTVNYALNGKYTHIPLVYNGNDVIEMDGKIPVLLIWDLCDSNFELAYLYFSDFLKKHKPSRIMVTGPTNNTSDCEEIIKKLFCAVLK